MLVILDDVEATFNVVLNVVVDSVEYVHELIEVEIIGDVSLVLVDDEVVAAYF